MKTHAEKILWHDAIKKMVRINDYQKTKELLNLIQKQLNELGETVNNNNFKPTNPRQEAELLHDKVKKIALEKQRLRLDKQLSLLEEQIKRDMTET